MSIRKFIEKLLPADIVLLGYYLFVGVFIVIGASLGRLENWWLYATHHALVLGLLPIFLVKVDVKGRDLLSFLRIVYPLFLFGLMYRETHDLDQVIIRRPLDYFFAQWDKMIFGFKPFIEFPKRYDSPLFSEFMHFGYFSYFGFVALLPLYWWFKGKPEMAQKRVFFLTFTYAVFYLFFIVLPVQGPRVQIPEAVNIERTGYFFAPFFEWLFDTSGIAGAAFPSSHCGIATLVFAMSIEDIPKFSPIVAIFTVLLYFSTIYGRFHYGVDVIYGAGLGTICYFFARCLHKKTLFTNKNNLLV